ncbi:hypothetical protein [Actinoplanes philippinensis]|uniref:hypothetical protein n=1 Tax=Actinoplanes philippinensis TaxID=35752 RepID=UPI001160CEA7|nr:hypothetical protein [Actinoplanes philippinensis]
MSARHTTHQTPGDQQLVEAWAARLAAEVLPHEAVDAPGVAVRFAAGGSQRAGLTGRASSGTGASGVDAVLDMVALLQALEAAGPHLRAFLESAVLANTVAVASLVTSVAAYLQDRRSKPAEQFRPPLGADPELAAHALAGAERMEQELVRRDTPPEIATARVEVTVRILASSPEEAARFLAAIAAAEQGSRRTRWFRRDRR